MIEEDKKVEILALDEPSTYLIIDECGAFMFRMNHEMGHGRIPKESHAAIDEDIIKVREIQQFVVDNLARFGVDPESANDRENGDYWKWFKHWGDWKDGLSNDDWSVVAKLIEENKSLEEYLPKTTWKN